MHSQQPHAKKKTISVFRDLYRSAFGRPAKTRFIILTSPRSGSNFLSALLRTHSNIVMQPEIFNLFSLSEKELDTVLNDPRSYLIRILDTKTGPTTEALGFKIFYSQANVLQLQPELNVSLGLPEPEDPWKNEISGVQGYINKNFDIDRVASRFEDVWAHLKKDTSIKVIHLIRKNKLKQLLSFYRATLMDQWKSYEKKKAEDKPVSLAYDECLNFFNKYSSWENEFDHFFSRHEKMPIVYEDLKKNKNDILPQIQRFLNVPIRENLSTRLVKQRKKSMSDMISNYDELKCRFSNSPWEQFFEE